MHISAGVGGNVTLGGTMLYCHPIKTTLDRGGLGGKQKLTTVGRMKIKDPGLFLWENLQNLKSSLAPRMGGV